VRLRRSRASGGPHQARLPGGTRGARPAYTGLAWPTPPEPTPAPTATPEPEACKEGASYVADLNYDDKNMTAPPVMQPGQPFTKGWRLRNSGTCTWTTGYALAYTSGNVPAAQMGGQPIPVTREVRPGETFDFQVNLIAPIAPGTYQGFWNMRNAQNQRFGETVWVGITVPGAATPTPAPTLPIPTQPPPTTIPTREPPTAVPTSGPATGGDATWNKIQQAGKIVVGTAADYAPFEFYTPDVKLDGFDIALMKAIGQKVGVEVEFNDFAFEGLGGALQLGQVDAAIAAASVTPQRLAVVDFSISPWLSSISRSCSSYVDISAARAGSSAIICRSRSMVPQYSWP